MLNKIVHNLTRPDTRGQIARGALAGLVVSNVINPTTPTQWQEQQCESPNYWQN